MRASVMVCLFLISLAFLVPPATSPAIAEEGCRCQGCGCKGGPGWRSPKGYCVSTASLAKICGSPPGAPCTQEAAERVCDRTVAAKAQTAGAQTQ